jgi:hypothetical protein
VVFFVAVAFYFGCAYLAAQFRGHVEHRTWVKVLFLPSVTLHAGCRAIGCLLSISPIEQVDFLRNKQPFLKAGRTRIPVFGLLLSSFGTHIPLFVVYFYLHSYLPLANWDELGLPALEELRADPALGVDYARSFIANIEFSPWALCMTAYIFLGLALSYDLRLSEVLATTSLSIVGCWVCGLLSWLGVGFPFLSRGWFLTRYYIPEWWGIGSAFVALTAASSLLVVFVSVGAFLLYSPRRGGKPSPRRAGSKPRTHARG